MNDVKITVYIPSHNYGKYLEEAIESVLRQSEKDWELLLIDDGSTDNTPEIMAFYQSDPRIRLFHTNGIGLQGVANLALIEARGRYIMRLDGDDYLDENALLVLGKNLDYHPEATLVFPDYYLVDEKGIIISLERRERLYENNHMIDLPANGACSLVRTDLLRDVGGYRTDVDAQDGLDLWLKMCRNHRCMNINLPLFYYRRHGNNLTEKTYRIYDARRYIKRHSIKSELEGYRPIIAVIPCRRNYDFQLDLWNYRLNGATLLDRAIKMSIASDLFDEIVVASDNKDVTETMDRYDDQRLSFFQRLPEETIRSRSIAKTLDRIADKIDPQRKGVSALNYIQAPFKSTFGLEEAVFTLILNSADTSIAVNEVEQTVYLRTATGMRAVNPPSNLNSDFNTVYIETNATLATLNRILKRGMLIGPSVVNYVLPDSESFFIRSERDIRIAKALVEIEETESQRKSLDMARNVIS